MAKLYPPLRGRYAGRPEVPTYPFMFKNRAGKGTAYYIAGTFFELYREYGITHYRRIIQELVDRHSSPVVELLRAPESVEFTVRESMPSGAILVHLINYTGGMTRPIGEVIPVRGLSLRVHRPGSSARALVSGRELQVEAGGLVELPEIGEFEVIVIE